MWMAFPHCAQLQSRAQGSVTSRGPKDGECVAGEKPAFGFRMEKDMSIRHVNKKEMSHTGKATGVGCSRFGVDLWRTQQAGFKHPDTKGFGAECLSV